MVDSTVAGSMAGSAVVDSLRGFQHSTVADSMPDFRHFMAADFMTAGLANSMTADFITLASFITMASIAALSWFPPSVGGGGAADGVGPIIIQAEAITATNPMQGIGITAPIRRATTPM